MYKLICLVGLWCASTLSVFAAPVAILQGGEGLPAGEQRFTQALANHAERWLKDSGIPVRRGDSRQPDAAIAGTRVAVLISPTAPTSASLAALKRYCAGGGKLIVCYSSSDELGKLMQVKCLGYKKPETAGMFSQMKFTSSRPGSVPESILQTSSNINAAEPLSSQASVIAWWADRQGTKTPYAACIASPHGWWFTHVWLGDGDTDEKAQMLLALCGAADPSIWETAARYRLSVAEAQADAIKVPSSATEKSVLRLQTALANLRAKTKEQLRARQFRDAWNSASDIQTLSCELYGALQKPRAGEICAVWDHSGQGLYPGNWPKTIALLKSAGVTDLYVNVAGGAFAHYASKILPQSRVCLEQGDQLAACLQAARGHGIRVHPWILCFATEQATEERLADFRKRGWLLKDADGSIRNWLDPANPKVRAYITAAVAEMAAYPNAAGVHLDFVRYPDYPKSTPAETRNKLMPDRRSAVTAFVHSARQAVRGVRKSKTLTAAVYGKYPACVYSVGQDWEAWIRMGLLDYVAPMNYTEDMNSYLAWLGAQTRTPTQAKRIIAGIGVTAAESRLNPIQVIQQINATRAAGCAGYALFDLDMTLRNQVLPVLRVGINKGKGQ